MKIPAKFHDAIIPSGSILRAVLIPALIAALLLLIPLFAMLISTEMEWSAGDFTAAWILFFITGVTYKLVTRKNRNVKYRAAAAIAVVAALMLVWVNLAVGIIGSEDNPANTMYAGVLAIGTIGALIAQFRPMGMSYALFATALAIVVVAIITLVYRLGAPYTLPVQIVFINGFFFMLFAVSGALFRESAQQKPPEK